MVTCLSDCATVASPIAANRARSGTSAGLDDRVAEDFALRLKAFDERDELSRIITCACVWVLGEPRQSLRHAFPNPSDPSALY